MTDNAKNYTLSAVFQSALTESAPPRPDPAVTALAEREVERLTGLSRSSGLIAASIAPTANGLVLCNMAPALTTPSVPTAPLEDDRRSVGCHELMAKYI